MPQPLLVSHWYHLIEGLQHSSKQFYAALEEEIKKRQLPNISIRRTDFREGGILSAKREYLETMRKDHFFDICAAPFGNGFFVSWWLAEDLNGFWGLIAVIPFIGPLLIKWFKPETYYRTDTTLMFQESIRRAVNDVIDRTVKAQGLRPLTELEQKPIMMELFKR